MKRHFLSATALSAFLLTGAAFAQSEGTAAQDPLIPQAGGQSGEATSAPAETGGTTGQAETSGSAGAATPVVPEAGATGEAGAAGQTEAGGAQPETGGAAAGQEGTAGATEAQPGSGTTTEGQAGTEAGQAAGGEAAGGDAAAGADGNAEAGADANSESNSEANATSESNSTTNVEVTQEQKTVIRNTIINNDDIERVDVDFDISIGVSVPQTYTFYDLPPEIIEIVPAYRTYRYFVLVDGTICIVHPDTYVIVYVIEA
jgi:hypothetical protein